VANLFPHWWYFSFFALTPFLYRIIRASPGESLRLGFLFGLSFFGAATTNSLITSPVPSVLRLISGTALFALFGWTVGRARQRWGFSPSIVAVLWVALELGLMKFGFTGGFVVNEVSLLLGEAGFSQPFLQGLVGLFGFLTVSAIIVLLNSLLVLVVVKTLEKTRPREKISAEDGRIWDFFFVRNLVAERAYLVPEGRAPPFLLVTVFV
jgi:apolipoprotein N-acyltransferase